MDQLGKIENLLQRSIHKNLSRQLASKIEVAGYQLRPKKRLKRGAGQKLIQKINVSMLEKQHLFHIKIAKILDTRFKKVREKR